MSDVVHTEQRDDVAVITFDESARLNPFSDAMRAAALAAVETAMDDATVRTLVLTGAGGNFSAGADIRQLSVGGVPDPARSRRRLQPLHRLVELIVAGPKPVIAAVEGIAFGAGLSLVAACDFVIASEGARFGAAFGKIGLTADCGLSWSLPQRIGLPLTKDILFTGRSIDSAEALRIGIVDRLVANGAALATAVAKAEDYRGVAPLSIAAMKAAIVQGPCALHIVFHIEAQQQPMLSMSADHEEGRKAFLEKRKPRFTGR